MYVPELKQIMCIPGASQGLHLPSNVFSAGDKVLTRLAPYMDILHPAVSCSRIHKSLGVQETLTLESLFKIQEQLLQSGPTLNSQDLDVAVAILHLASGFPRNELPNLMSPDQHCKLVNIADLTVGGESLMPPGSQ